jgi:pimeloyl-ACP methyl ester carboxylesterase
LPRVTEAVTPFRVVTSSAAISDARRRLQATRWPERQTADDWRQGAPLATIQALVAYWRTAYDWRRLERRLNAYPQFRTEIDGLGIHFLHVRSPHEHARPIILTHGWPGSIVEFLNVICPLTNPTKHGGQPEDAFHVVLPSLPGFGFSDKPTESGWGLPRIARAWSVLMRRLGYTDYLAQGGDWGAGVTTWMAKQQVAGLAAIHLNLPILFPPPVEGEPNQAEKATIAQLVAFNDKKAGYAKIQSTLSKSVLERFGDVDRQLRRVLVSHHASRGGSGFVRYCDSQNHAAQLQSYIHQERDRTASHAGVGGQINAPAKATINSIAVGR